MEQAAVDVSDMREWARAETFDDFAQMCCGQRHLTMLNDPDSFSLSHRVARMGPVTLSEIAVESDLSMDCGDVCGSYRVLMVQEGRTECVYNGLSVIAGPGSAAVFAPEGLTWGRWDAGTKMMSFKIDRCAVEDALSDALGRQVTPRIDFAPILSIERRRPAAGSTCCRCSRSSFSGPTACSINHWPDCRSSTAWCAGFLLAADHPHRSAQQGRTHSLPRAPSAPPSKSSKRKRICH